MANYYTRSPPPLQHPVPTHPAFIPEPPSTPISPQGYQRYASSPPTGQPANINHPSLAGMAAGAAGYPQFQQPMQPGQIPPQHGHGVPDFSSWGIDGATAQLGMQLGQNAMSAGQQYVQKNLGGILPTSQLKYHFNVSNSYVMHKIRLLLFPWRHRPWTRKLRRSEQGQPEFQPPRDDINSPDLYIPVMAFVTYILLAALQSGLQSRFDPEILGYTASTALFIMLLDFCVLKGGCYLLGVQNTAPVVDAVAYGGYKFVGVIMTIITGILNLGRTIWIIAFIYAFLANAFFLLRSLRSVVLPDASAPPGAVGTVTHAQRSRRITFLFLIAVTQVLYMGLLVRV